MPLQALVINEKRMGANTLVGFRDEGWGLSVKGVGFRGLGLRCISASLHQAARRICKDNEFFLAPRTQKSLATP